MFNVPEFYIEILHQMRNDDESTNCLHPVQFSYYKGNEIDNLSWQISLNILLISK